MDLTWKKKLRSKKNEKHEIYKTFTCQWFYSRERTKELYVTRIL